MANKTFKGRIKNKHDTSVNWATAHDNNFIPLDGELIVYDDLNKVKIGDGTTKVEDLPFLNLDAYDVQTLINNSLSLLDVSDISIDKHYVSAVKQADGLISVERKPFPQAGANSTGIVKGFHHTTGAATGTQVTNATNAPAIATRTTTSGRYYGVETDKNGALFINVPWTDEKVKQNLTSTSGDYPVLIKYTTTATDSLPNQSRYGAGVTINPSNSKITTKNGEQISKVQPALIQTSLNSTSTTITPDLISLTEDGQTVGEITYSNKVMYSTAESFNIGGHAQITYDETEKCLIFSFV